MKVQWVGCVYKTATLRIAIATVLFWAALLAQTSQAQPVQPAAEIQRDWRRVGNAAIDRSLAGLATGPVNRVWYSNTGSLMVQTASGRVLETADFEKWKAIAPGTSVAVPPNPQNALAVRLPENGAMVRVAVGAPSTNYAFGKFVYRSETGGASWDNLTAFRNVSIIGDDIRDLAVSPSNPDEIVVAGGAGVFRSLDAGKTWSGLNQALPNLPAVRLLSLPSGDRGVRLALAQPIANGVEWSAVEWEPGQKLAWRGSDDADLKAEFEQRAAYLKQFAGAKAVAASGDSIYVGTTDGRIIASNDHGATWTTFPMMQAGAVERFWIDPSDPRMAVAVLGMRQRDPSLALPAVHVVHTTNGGRDWEPMGNLPDIGVYGVTVDRGTNALYIATDRGVYMAYSDLRVLGADVQWTPVGGLPPEAPVADVKLDAQGNQLWAAVYGYGVYSTLAPHRARDPRVVSTMDLAARAAAPGSLISVLGTRVQTARAGDLNVPVLDANENESQLQVPFEARGDSLSLAVDGPNGRLTMPMQLQSVSPGIFVDRDGSPLLADGDSGVMLDAMNTAHSRGRIQIMASGLGRVSPDWPTGIAGPVENPPQVVAPVKAFLDGQPVEVGRAVLGPFIGFYLVEIEVPKIVNYGAAELYLEVGGKATNKVRVYIQP
jgi:uncharacterized protein (TIGR03437 family)